MHNYNNNNNNNNNNNITTKPRQNRRRTGSTSSEQSLQYRRVLCRCVLIAGILTATTLRHLQWQKKHNLCQSWSDGRW